MRLAFAVAGVAVLSSCGICGSEGTMPGEACGAFDFTTRQAGAETCPSNAGCSCRSATSALCANFATVPPAFTEVSLSDHGERPENAKWMSEDDFEHLSTLCERQAEVGSIDAVDTGAMLGECADSGG